MCGFDPSRGQCMRQIGTIASEREAELLESYLLTQGIKTQRDPIDDGWAIWVHDEDRVSDGRREIEVFQQDPGNPRYSTALEESRKLRAETARTEQKRRKNVVDLSTTWNRASPARRPITFALIIVSAAVALLTGFGDENASLIQKLSIASYQVSGLETRWNWLSDIRHGEVWRLVTPIFLHFSILHLVFNMYWLSALGSMIEINRGFWKYLLIVLLLAVASNYGQYQMGGSPRFGGMSGVNYGLFGYLWMKGRYDPQSNLGVHPNTVVIMMGWFVLCTAGLVGAVANWAHGFGLLAGICLALAPLGFRKAR